MRQLGILTVGAVLVSSICSIVFAVLDQWILAFVSLVVMLVVFTLSGLLQIRYLARLLRTESNKSKQAAKNHLRSLESSVQQLDLDLNALKDQVWDIPDRTSKINKAHIDKLETKIWRISRSIRSHTVDTVRHSTSEVEALLQIYSEFQNTKLPMPVSGGWAIDAQSLAYLLEYVRDTKPRLIVELGSGTSTIWLGYLCKSIGAKLITVDHLSHYLQQTQAAVDRHDLNNWVECRLAPLEDLELDEEIYSWYSIEALADLYRIDLLLVDGPPARTGREARLPALPVLEAQLSAESAVILDDAHRSDEENILDKWLTRYPKFQRVAIGTPRLAIISRSNDMRNNSSHSSEI